MRREFSEEKRQEIFRLLDEIDNKEWKSFMEWSGSRAEEYGDWPDKLAVSAYTRYVDAYHEKVLEINEMTRQQVNTVFENVAEIDARYAARMREHREKVKEQIAIVKTMTEFMESMANGWPNMALLNEERVNKTSDRPKDFKEEKIEENRCEKPIEVVDGRDVFSSVFANGQEILEQCLRDHDIKDQDEINIILEWVLENDCMKLWDLCRANAGEENQRQNIEVVYESIMDKYNAYLQEYFLKYAAESIYCNLYDWEEVASVLQKINPRMLINLYEAQSENEKTEVFDSILEIYNVYRIEQGANILKNFIDTNGEFIDHSISPELIIPFLQLFVSDKLIALYETKDTSGQDVICQSLINFYVDERETELRGKIFYTYTWLQINSIESFTNNDEYKNFNGLVDDFVRIYGENKEIYTSIAEETGIPPEVIAVIHYRENSTDFLNESFNIDLRNGKLLEGISRDEFVRRAVNAVRSQQGNIERFNLSLNATDIVAMVCFAEVYNGMGYYDNHHISPYSYSGTDVYESGKYIRDGVFDPEAVDQQIGTYRLLLAAVSGIYDAEQGRNYVNEMLDGDIQ